MKSSTKKLSKNKITVGVGQAWFPAWMAYKDSLKQTGAKVIALDLFNPGWAGRLKKVDHQIDFYVWHSDTWEENYRKIHDRVYFIEKILKKPVFPDLNQYYAYNDKIKQKEIFDFLKIPRLQTHIALEKEKALQIINKMTYPAVIKDAYSACGEAVFKINSKTEAKKIVEKIFSRGYKGIKNYLYIQKFVPGLKGDLRIITLGNKIAVAYWRRSEKDWRHNICRGAKADFENIPQKAKNFCLKLSKKMKFHWMAYDLIIEKNKIFLLEWSCNFGLNAPKEKGINVRAMMADYMVKNYKKYERK